MISSITVILVLLIALTGALANERGAGLISRQPYNNPYSDASGARDR